MSKGFEIKIGTPDVNTVPCRECKEAVGPSASTCPHCGAQKPWKQDWNGPGFEYKSEASLFGLPLVHVAFGKDAKGKRRVAKGIIAVGQFALGFVTVAQFGVGVLFGFGQFMLSLVAIAQFAGSAIFAVAQFGAAYAVVGQFAFGKYVVCQIGWGVHQISPGHIDPVAVEFFKSLLYAIGLPV